MHVAPSSVCCLFVCTNVIVLKLVDGFVRVHFAEGGVQIAPGKKRVRGNDVQMSHLGRVQGHTETHQCSIAEKYVGKLRRYR